jgi:hypothetical protein
MASTMASFAGRRRALQALAAAGATPWLEALHGARPARAAADKVAKRLIVFFVPGGRTPEAWRPTGGETDFVLPMVLAPLEPFRRQLVTFQGIDAKTYPDGAGANHPNGTVGLLTGVPAPPGPFLQGTGFPKARSVDQVIGGVISQGLPFRTLELGVLWPTIAGGPASNNVISYAEPGVPAPPMSDPYAAVRRVFGGLGAAAPAATASAAAKTPAQVKADLVLGALLREYGALTPRLGAGDRARLEAHAQRLSEIKTALQRQAAQPVGGACAIPAIGPDKSLSAQRTRVRNTPQASLTEDLSARLPELGALMSDIAVAALACNLTRVVTIQWTDTMSRNTFPWLNLPENHHYYQHDGGYRPAEMATIGNWYVQQMASLARKLSAVGEGGGTLLDGTVILYCSEISHPTHDYKDMPFALLGGAGGAYRTGRFLKYGTPVAHNQLLVSLLNAFGIEAKAFGDPKYGAGPLPGLV